MCFEFLYNFCLKHFSFQEEMNEIRLKMRIGLHVNYRYSCQVLLKLEFSRQNFKNAQISNLMKIRPVTAELFHVDKHTDISRLVVAFRNFMNWPKKYFYE